MARDVSDTTPLSGRDELVGWIEAGCKPADQHRIGTEHEKVPFYRADRAPVPYEGRDGVGGIRHLLEGMRDTLGWEPILDGEHIIGLADGVGGGAISLEPGGQFELSGAPLQTIHETHDELIGHFAALTPIAEKLGIEFLSLGMSPKWTLAETPVMPKSRYTIMAGYMPKVGTRGLDMMFRTCTVQANYDFSSEADMVKKLRVSIALQPLATALFANSPFKDGRLTGSLSERAVIWRDTDNARAGMLPFVFEDGMGYERYVDYALAVPMYFVKRGERYHDVAGADFRDLMAGSFAPLPGETAVLSDWANHLSTIFPEVRLKRFLEMRGADAGPMPLLVALPALFTGLLYSASSLDAAWDLVKTWTAAERETMWAQVPSRGLDTTIAGRSLRDVGREVLKIARAGLAERAFRDAQGRDETMHLDVLDAILAGRTEAERLIALFKGPWGESVDPSFEQCVY
ncbi:glutamate--cysteine ligase [Beijerinckia sp. L45]|uniref:glutamate--cysteine ligase n=1 Tax=Beijerinckia sp. L45 TaxID=1641855 RepID=UPI00131EA18C|nr:glutamate--cysteine ligase [Beijerinckia sp. L45]